MGYEIPGPGDFKIAAILTQGSQTLVHSTESFSVSRLYLADYGESLPTSGKVALWWCDGTRKVSRIRKAPERRSKGVQISCAGDEYEPFQVVVNTDEPLKGFDVGFSAHCGLCGP